MAQVDFSKYSNRAMLSLAISESIRNAMEAFHGNFGGEKNGFITDEQMFRINICIRKATYEALQLMEKVEAKDPKAETDFAWTIGGFSYEMPGTDELEKLHKKYVEDYEGIDYAIYKKWAEETTEGVLKDV